MNKSINGNQNDGGRRAQVLYKAKTRAGVDYYEMHSSFSFFLLYYIYFCFETLVSPLIYFHYKYSTSNFLINLLTGFVRSNGKVANAVGIFSGCSIHK